MHYIRSVILTLLIAITSIQPVNSNIYKTKNTFISGLMCALTANIAEDWIFECSSIRKTENRLLNSGYHATGFSLCLARKIAGILASDYYGRGKMAELMDKDIQTSSAWWALVIGTYRHLSPYQKHGNNTGLRAGCQEYWQRWDTKLLSDKRAWENRKRID